MGKRLLSMVMVIAMLFTMIPDNVLRVEASEENAAVVSDGTQDAEDSGDLANFQYSLDSDGNATITGYSVSVSALNIPEILDGHTVVGIKANAFKGNEDLMTLTMPDSVTSIGASAFSGCTNLTTVKLSKNLEKMGYDAFYNCDQLSGIEIPGSLTVGGAQYNGARGAFRDCDGLETVTFEVGTSEIAQYLFAGCTGISEITIPDTVTIIEQNAFYGCTNLSAVTISKNLTKIEDGAFYGCTSLSEVNIPDSVTGIGNSAFAGCTKLATVKLSINLEKIGYDAFYNCDQLSDIEIPKSLTVGGAQYNGTRGAFRDCDGLETVTFETGTTEIAEYLFAGCTGIAEITVPDTVTSIEQYAFYGCTNLSEITISNNVAEIGDYAFSGCASLAKVDIPDSVTSIGGGVFADCTHLATVRLSKNLESMGYDAFYNCDQLSGIEIPKSLTVGGAYHQGNNGAFRDCDGLKQVTFEAGTTEIAEYLFAGCTGILEITIPDTVETIEQYAFYGCVNLASVALSEGLTTIGSYAFYGDSSLREIDIPDSVTGMGTYIFAGCTSLESVALPKNRNYIAEGTFRNCTGLKTIELPDTVQTIRQYAFESSGLEEITFPQTVLTIENHAFRNCDALTAVTLPDSVTSIGTYCFAESELLKDVTLGNGLTTIPSYAFDACPALEEVILPYRTLTVDSNAFTNCNVLKKLTIPRATTGIGSNAVSNPTELTVYGVTGTYAETWAESVGATFVNQEVPATALSFEKTKVDLAKGTTASLVLSVTPADFTDTITWESSDDSVATVTDGKVKGITGGTVTITASAGDTGTVQAVCTVTVVQAVTEIKLNKSSLSLKDGESFTLVATVSPEDANNKAVTWISSDERIATVSEGGVVKALDKGTAEITATACDGTGISKTCTVTVERAVTGISLNKTNLSLEVGENDTLVATVSPSDADNKEIIWASSDKSVATVSEGGVVTAVKPGTAQITATAGDGSGVSKTCTVTVVRMVTGITLNKTTLSLKVGENGGLTVTISPADASNQAVTWASSNTSVATVSEDGVVTAVAKGTARITVTAGDGSGISQTCDVTVVQSVKEIKLNKTSLSLKVGETDTLGATVSPAEADNQAVTWKSSNTSVATVSEDGVVTAVAKGTAQITATAGDGSAVSDTCTVTVVQPLENVILEETQMSLHAGQIVSVPYKIVPENATVDIIKVTSSDEKIVGAKLSDDAGYIEITALSGGNADVTLEVNGLSVTCSVAVEDTILLDYQDGTGKTEKMPAVCGEKLSGLAMVVPEREGYEFVGWYTRPNGEGKQVTQDTVLVDQWILYACWRDLSEERFRVEPVEAQTYTGKAVKPVVRVYFGKVLLQEKKDYTVSYKNNTNAYSVRQDEEAFDSSVAPTAIVTGKGDYSGKISVYFVIDPKNINDSEFEAPNLETAFNGQQQLKVPSLTYDKKKLIAGKDFTYSYPDLGESEAYTGAGREYIIRVEGKGNYTGTRDVILSILDYDSCWNLSKVSVSKIADKSYTGEPIELTDDELVVTLKKAGEVYTLSNGTDYTVEYRNNTQVGTATAIIKGIHASGYGSKKITFKITGESLTKAFVTGIKDKVYTGDAQTQQLDIKVGDSTLVEGKDYEITYSRNVSVGTATATIKGIGKYTGSIKKTFKITSCKLSDFSDVELTISGQTMKSVSELEQAKLTENYTKGGCKPEVMISVGGKMLKNGTDYTVSYANNGAITDDNTVKLPVLTIKGKGNYQGVITKTFSIAPKSLRDVFVLAPDIVAPKKAGGYTTKLVITDTDGKTLKAGTDYVIAGYTATYADGRSEELTAKSAVAEVGTRITVSLEGKGAYTGTLSAEYRIVEKAFKGLKVSAIQKNYNGEAITLTADDFKNEDGSSRIAIKDGSSLVDLVYGKDFEIVAGSYKNNIKRGTASVTIKGCGEYGGVTTIKFKIAQRQLNL